MPEQRAHPGPERAGGTVRGSASTGGVRIGPALWIAAVVFTIAAVLAVRHAQDFEVFWRAGRRFVTGADLFPGTDGFLEWRYLPATALLFLPVAPLPLAAARLAWLALSVGFGVASIAVLLRGPAPTAPGIAFRPQSPEGQVRPGKVVLLGLAAASRPILEEFACGQVNLLVLLMLLLAFREMDRGREFRAGVIVAVATGMKVTPALLLVDAALRRRWRVLAGAAFGVAFLLAISVPFYGLDGAVALHRSWILGQVRVSGSLVPAPANQSIFAAVARAHGPTWLAVVLAGGLTIVALAAARESRRAILLLALTIASPMGWIQNYVLAIPAALRVAQGRHARAAAVVGIALALTVYDVTGPRFEAWVFTRSLPLVLGCALFGAAFERDRGRTTAPEPDVAG